MFGHHVDRSFNFATGKRPNMDSHLIMSQELYPDAHAAQIWVSIPKRREVNIKPEEIPGIVELAQKMPINAHSAYAAANWYDSDESLRHVISELEMCKKCGLTGLVVHLPKLSLDANSKIKQSIDILSKCATPQCRIIFETPAHVRPHTFYCTPEDLRALILCAPRERWPCIGICIDTAHLWVCGQQMDDPKFVTSWLSRLDKLIEETGVFVMWHLNDSANEFGRGPDEHAIITEGHIWGENHDALSIIVHYIRRKNMTAIFEVKNVEEIERAYDALRTLDDSGIPDTFDVGALQDAIN